MEHRLICADSRDMSFIPDESVHLVVTSPPYWNIKDYSGPEDSQLGSIDGYEDFVSSLSDVWRETLRVLVPGGRLVCNVGDVQMSKKNFGRHFVIPLHADMSRGLVDIGFDYLSPIIWNKISNIQFESGENNYLGAPYLPNGIVKNEIEYILLLRKPGGYRKPTAIQREMSIIPKDEYHEMFSQIWTIRGVSKKKNHPAPYPLVLAERLVRMFSYSGDVVLDPFVGSGTTSVAAANHGRSSIGIDVSEEYISVAEKNIREAGHDVKVDRSEDR